MKHINAVAELRTEQLPAPRENARRKLSPGAEVASWSSPRFRVEKAPPFGTARTMLVCVLLAALACCLSVRASDKAQAPAAYQISGTLVATNYLAKNGRTIDFDLLIGGDRYLLTAGAPEPCAFGTTAVGYNGTSQYRYMYVNSLPVTQLRVMTNVQYYVDAVVEPGVRTPQFDANYSLHIWFAFAPQRAIEGALNPCDLVNPSHLTPCNRMLKASFDPATRRPVFAALLSDGSEPGVGRLPGPLGNGFTNLVFASVLTNWPSAGILPAGFEFHCYAPLGSNVVQPVWSLFGTVASVEAIRGFDPKPSIQDPTHVTDYRARLAADSDKGQIQYVTRKGWLEPSDAAFIKLLKEPDPQKVRARRRAMFIIGAAAAVSIYVWFARRRRHAASQAA